MARLSTIPEYPRTDQPPLLDAAEKWKQKCLLADGSVFSNSSLWTVSNLNVLNERFSKKPITGDQPFLEKFRQQLDATSEAVKQLAAELLWLLLLFPSNIGGPKKRQNILEVWSWSGEKLSSSHTLLSILDRGIGSAGQAFNQRRDLELSFAIRATQIWKEMEVGTKPSLIENPWAFGNWIDRIPDASNRGLRHMILFLLFSDSYERTATGGHKNAIVNAFASLAKESTAQEGDSPAVVIDKNLFSIRKSLEHEYPNQEIDFYRPPIEEMWRKTDAHDDEEAADVPDKARVESDLGPRIWIEKTLVKGRPDREQGEHRLGSALWSPQKAKNGADIYRDMRMVREGDVVLHLIDNRQFSGVSLAAGAVNTTFQGLPDTPWEGPAYRIQLRDYLPLDPPFEREDFLVSPVGAAELRKVLEQHTHGLFYNADLDLNQGKYLTRAPIELVEALNRIYSSLYGKALPHLGNLISATRATTVTDSYSEEDAMSGIFLDFNAFKEMLLVVLPSKTGHLS